MDHNPVPHYFFCDIVNKICCISEKNFQGSSSHDGAAKDITRRGESLLLLQTQSARQNFAGSALCQVKKAKGLTLLSESIIFTFLIKGSIGKR